MYRTVKRDDDHEEKARIQHDSLLTGLKTNDPYTLDQLAPGKHSIKIDLQQNDHQSYGVEKVFEIEVK